MDLQGPDFSDSRNPMIISSILGTRIGSLKHLNKTLDLVFVTKP